MIIPIKEYKDERVRNKTAFTFDDHGATAVRLATVEHYLEHITPEIGRAYGQELSNKAEKAVSALRDLIYSLNGQLRHESGPRQRPDTVYFPDDEGGVTNAPIFESDLREKYLGAYRNNDIDCDDLYRNRPTGKKFSTDEHIAVGRKLRAIANYIGALLVMLSHSYSINSHMIQCALRFYDGCGGGALGTLICALDSQYFRDCPKVSADVRYIYYEDGTEAANRYFNLSQTEAA